MQVRHAGGRAARVRGEALGDGLGGRQHGGAPPACPTQSPPPTPLPALLLGLSRTTPPLPSPSHAAAWPFWKPPPPPSPLCCLACLDPPLPSASCSAACVVVQNLGALLSIVPNCENVKSVIFMDDQAQSPSDEHRRLAGAAGGGFRALGFGFGVWGSRCLWVCGVRYRASRADPRP